MSWISTPPFFSPAELAILVTTCVGFDSVAWGSRGMARAERRPSPARSMWGPRCEIRATLLRAPSRALGCGTETHTTVTTRRGRRRVLRSSTRPQTAAAAGPRAYASRARGNVCPCTGAIALRGPSPAPQRPTAGDLQATSSPSRCLPAAPPAAPRVSHVPSDPCRSGGGDGAGSSGISPRGPARAGLRDAPAVGAQLGVDGCAHLGHKGVRRGGEGGRGRDASGEARHVETQKQGPGVQLCGKRPKGGVSEF